MVFNSAYIIFFANFLLYNFCTIPTWRDYLLISWTATHLTEEIRKITVAYDSVKRKRVWKYLKDQYNILIAGSVVTFIIGAALKLTAPEKKEYGLESLLAGEPVYYSIFSRVQRCPYINIEKSKIIHRFSY